MSSSVLHWLSMGGYWPFVWPSYILTLVVVLANIFFARRSQRDALMEARRRVQMSSTRASGS